MVGHDAALDADSHPVRVSGHVDQPADGRGIDGVVVGVEANVVVAAEPDAVAPTLVLKTPTFWLGCPSGHGCCTQGFGRCRSFAACKDEPRTGGYLMGGQSMDIGSRTRGAAALVAASPVFSRAAGDWRRNVGDRNMPMSSLVKARVGSYLVLRDYGVGRFPPRHDDQEGVHGAEESYRANTPGLTYDEVTQLVMRKPFWCGKEQTKYLEEFSRMSAMLEKSGVLPPARLLELAGGAGWTAEFLATMGYDVVSTTIAADDVASGSRRVDALRVKGLEPRLKFVRCAMERVDELTHDHGFFDAVFVYEALHHAFDWRTTLSAAFQVLRPGGHLLIFGEPNLAHTVIAYRVALLTNVIERGFRYGELRRGCTDAGFTDVKSLRPGPGFGLRSHWLRATRSSSIPAGRRAA